MNLSQTSICIPFETNVLPKTRKYILELQGKVTELCHINYIALIKLIYRNNTNAIRDTYELSQILLLKIA